MKLTVNESTNDRIIRAVIGVALVLAALLNVVSGALAVVALVVGVVVLFTAVTGFCALYAVFGISTCPVQNNK
jgi:hypothetical protein